MVQTVRSVSIPAGHKLLMIEKPLVLCRIFFGVYVFAPQTSWYESQMSLGDPAFRSYFALGGPVNYFEARGEGINTKKNPGQNVWFFKYTQFLPLWY